MKSSLILPLCTAALVAAVYPPQVVLGDSQAPIAEPDKYLIELAPGETQWVHEDDKWALRRVRTWLSRPSGAAG
jgi:leucyl aminopeptidase